MRKNKKVLYSTGEYSPRVSELISELSSLAKDAPDSISTPDLAFAYIVGMFPQILKEKREHFICVGLDGRRRPIYAEIVSIGTLTATLVHPREVLRRAIIDSAFSILIVHNHPSGDPSPSREDQLLTERLDQCCKLFGITLDDHIILGGTEYVSLRKEGLLIF